MQIIKTPTGTIKVDETTKKLTQTEYDALGANKKDGIYLITDSSKKNIIGLYKDGIQINNFPASKIALTPSGALTKSNVQEAIIENDSHITTTKNNLSSHVNNTSNPHKVTKTQVGLGNVDNTSDANKPVSTAQKNAIDAVNTSLTTHTGNTTVHITAAERTKWNDKSDINSINSKIGTSDISTVGTTITGAISSLATIIGVGNSSSGGTTLTGDISTLKSNLSSHINNTTVHITAAERTTWNSKAAGNHTHNSIKDSNDGNTITITYSKAGQLSTSWLASWNGRELGAISPSKITAGSLNYFQNTSSVNMGQDTSTSNGIGYVNDYSGTKLTENVADGALYRQAYSDRWVHEIYGDYRTGQIAVRGKNNGTWQSWRTILDSNNYSSYAATKNHTHSQYYDSGVSRTANTVLAAPNGSNGAASFRKLVAADIPSLTRSKISDLGTAATKNIGDFAINTLLTNQNLNDITSPGFYNAGGGNTVTNKPSGVDHFGLQVIHRASGAFYTQKIYSDTAQYTRKCVNGAWGSWTEDKLTDTNTTYSTATQSANGLMSAADKKKLDGIAAGANSYTLPTASASTLGGIKVGTNLSISNGVLSSTNTWRGIQNNLTSTATDQSLSAAQGKILNESKQNIRNGSVGTIDWDRLTTPGTYKIQGCTMTAAYHAPVNIYSFGILNVLDSESGGENRIMQIYYPHNTSSFHIRMRNNGAWDSWKNYTPNTWRGIQNNLTSDSTTDSLSAAQGKVLKGLVDKKVDLADAVVSYNYNMNFSSIKDLPQSYVGSACSDQWYNIINVRHRNNRGDGSNYGMIIYSSLTDGSSLCYTKQFGGEWMAGSRTILDSANYTSYAAKASHTHNYAGSSSAGGAATNADKVDGFHASQTAGSKSTCVVTDANGYTNLNYINSNTGNNENPTVSQIIVTNGSDNYYRKASLSHVKSALGSMPASDVYSWAKASTKPSYSWSEIGSKPSSFNPSAGSLNYVRVYNSSNIGQSSTVTFNDLANQHSAVAMINPATDNPVGKQSWCHCISMAWTNNSNSNWVSQIALGTEAGTGMWYRTTSGAITGRGWNRVLDSANYTSYCTPGKVKQSNTTAANDHRILISASANDTEETNQVYKSSKLTFNPYLGSFACGNNTAANNSYSHAEGNATIASGKAAHAEGHITTASGNNSHAEGELTNASGYNSHAEGSGAIASGNQSHAEGASTTASGAFSHAEGFGTITSGESSHAEGGHTTASNSGSHAGGHYNATMTTGGNSSNTTGTAFVIGNGTGTTALSNAFSVQYNGVVKAKSSITGSTTADYAEFFEWEDGNPDNEDRVGKFVTINNDKILIATDPEDYILGIVSGEPFVLGNGDCDTWNGMYLRDEFNRTIYEPAPKMELDEETGEEKEVLDENGNPVYYGTRPKLNPDYDPSQTYISRFDRKEWAPIGMLGVLSVIHDGTCKVNGYAKCNKNGIATACKRTDPGAYRVIAKMSDTVVRVIFR